MSTISLLSTTAYVETPFIHVNIAGIDFGIYQKDKKLIDRYPNYIQSLNIKKINGQVNSYTLQLNYTVTENNDPNFFEKVFSKASKDRKIVFSYGDMSLPNYIYKEEEAIITKVKVRFSISSLTFTYIVYAISKGNLTNVGVYTFPAAYKKPSEVIYDLLKNPIYGLQDLFVGMRNISLVAEQKLIPGNDMQKELSAKTMSVLDYLKYLVEMMTPITGNTIQKPSIYVLEFVDDTSGIFGGTYFRIVEVDTNITHSEAYNLDIGFPGNNVVIDIQVENDEEYAIYYDYQQELNSTSYVTRVGYTGEDEEVYAPILSSGNEEYKTREEDKTWWSKVTEFPIKCSVTLKGLLRPAILMEYVRLNWYIFGKKYISSGLYIITSQEDSVGYSGYQTTLNMIRIAADEEIY